MPGLPKGIQLTLMVGPLVPLPAPQPIIESFQSAQVTIDSGGESGFSLELEIDLNSPLLGPYLTLLMPSMGGDIEPIVRVVLVATISGISEVLIDGVVSRYEVKPATGGKVQISILGTDLTSVMSMIDFSGIPYPAMPREARVALIIAKYAALGIIPTVIPSILLDVPLPTEIIPRQDGDDLAYVRRLADEVGYVFYIQPGPVAGMSIAYWGPEIRVGVPQPALTVDMGPFTNVENISFSFDSEGATLPVVYIHDSTTKAPIPVPIPNVNPLSPPLGLIPPLPKRVTPLNETGKYSPLQAVMIGLANAARTADAARASGSLDVLRYGRTLKARSLVGVRGAGLPFNGLYYVRKVTHSIKPGEYKQNFELVRNGLVSTVPTVGV